MRADSTRSSFRSAAPHSRRVEISEDDQRAITGVADCLIGRAGRTTLAMALRGSRAQRVRQFQADQARGHGYFAGAPEAEVLARIDALISEGILEIKRRDGYPLIGYTQRGLELAVRFAAEEWLSLLRARVQPVASGAPLELPFIMAVMPNRNNQTVFLLIDFVEREADATWLPLLRAWSAAETRRVRGRLQSVISVLETSVVQPPRVPGGDAAVPDRPPSVDR